MNSETERARENLAADFKAIVADAEELLHVTAGQAGEKAGAVRDRIQQRLRLARAEFDAVEAAAGIAAAARLLISSAYARRPRAPRTGVTRDRPVPTHITFE